MKQNIKLTLDKDLITLLRRKMKNISALAEKLLYKHLAKDLGLESETNVSRQSENVSSSVNPSRVVLFL